MSTNFDSYQIYYKTNLNDTYTYYDTSSVATPIIKSLSPNTGYYIRLIPYSNSSNFYGSSIDTYIYTLPIINSQDFSSSTYTSITIKWTGLFNKTAVYYSENSDSTYTYYNTYTPLTTTATINYLKYNKLYKFKLTPLNNIDVSGTDKYIIDTSMVPCFILPDIGRGATNTNSSNPNIWSNTKTGLSNTLMNGTYYMTLSNVGSNNWINNGPQNCFILPDPSYVNISNKTITKYATNFYSNLGIYNGTTSTIVDSKNYYGEYLQVQIPNAAILRYYNMKSTAIGTAYADALEAPYNWILAGSNDGTTFTMVQDMSSASYSVTNHLTVYRGFDVFTNNSYSYYRLIVLNTNSTSPNNGNSGFGLNNFTLSYYFP